MSTRTTSLLGHGMYFIDVLACLLFCITLALVGARFGAEQIVQVDLPSLERAAGPGAAISAPSVVVRWKDGTPQIFFENEAVTLAQLESRLRSATPPSVIVRAEESALSSVIAAAHAAGVPDIQLAYELERSGGERR